jgi:hypothetical protein
LDFNIRVHVAHNTLIREQRPTVRRRFATVRRLASGTLFATDATSRQKNFNEINDLRAAASAAKSLIYKELFSFLAPCFHIEREGYADHAFVHTGTDQADRFATLFFLSHFDFLVHVKKYTLVYRK